MNKTCLVTACLLGALAVALGAFGAHGLKKIVDADTVSTFQAGVQYQIYHSFSLLATAILFEKFPGRWLKWAGSCFIFFIILFSGSFNVLYTIKGEELSWSKYL